MSETECSMVERVARAMCRQSGIEWEKQSDTQRSYNLSLARTAIEVMREPSKKQIEAMEPWSRVSGHHEMVWRAGIDAALST